MRAAQFWRLGVFVFILTVAAVSYARLPGHRNFDVFDTDPPTPYAHYTPTGTSLGRVLVVHGLNANKNVMNLLSYALAAAGFETFAIDLPGHGGSRAPFNGLRARAVLEQVLDRLGPDTALLGHSFGGALLLDIASDRHVNRMVLFSPAPAPLEHVLADRILVLEGQFDPEGIRVFAPQIEASTAGAFEYRDLAWTSHSGGLIRPGVIEGVAEWLGGRTGRGHTRLRLALLALMLAAGIGAGIQWLAIIKPATFAETSPDSPRRAILYYVLYYIVGALAAAGVLALINVASWLRFFVTDYLIGFVLLAGLFLCLRYRLRFRSSRVHLLIALGAAAYVVVVIGWPLAELTHVTLSGSRWWRFPVLVMLGLPLFLSDETLLRPLHPGIKATGAAILTRILLGSIAASGVMILNRESAFLVLLIHMIILFWIALWFAAGWVRGRTDAVSAALFAAMIQAWIFSALFVTA